MLSQNTGTLFLIGGHEDKTGRKVALRRFVELAGGHNSRLVIMTCASGEPVESGNEYQSAFEELGAARITTFHSDESGTCDFQQAAPYLRRATGIFFVGGEPGRILAAMKDTPFEALLSECVRCGCVLAGTSAGALVMTDFAVIDGERVTDPQKYSPNLEPGLSYLTDIILDVHFAERGRCGRMLALIAKHPSYLGLGIDEDTALEFRNDEFEVVGSGSVFIFDASLAECPKIRGDESDSFAMANVHLS